MKAFFLVLLFLSASASASGSLRPVPEHGLVTIPLASSFVPSADGRVFVPGPPGYVTGELKLPEGDGPFPAVVLAHGCNGNSGGIERVWGPELRRWGFATLVIDSFTARGILEVCTGASRLHPLQRVPDAYGALGLLARHPRIDPARIALMGFSHGGSLTLIAASAWARDTFVPGGAPAFRAFFPFYPNCNAEYPERRRVSAPVRIHTGEADDWTPARPCAELATVLRAAGEDVAARVYPGAHHGFDQATRFVYRPEVNNGGGCFLRLGSILGPMLPGSSSRGCVTKGATIAGHPGALAAAKKNLRDELEALMK